MDDAKVGRLVRTVRVHLGLRQIDVAARAAVSQTLISLIEAGQLERVSVARFRRVCATLGIECAVEVRWRGGFGDRLIDRGHAAIVELVIGALKEAGWESVAEFSFNVYGDRGSVDVLAWHAETRTLLIVEVKTRLTDLQAMLLSQSRKTRVVPTEAAKRLGWRPEVVGSVLAVAGTHANRSVVRAHRATFDAVLPATSVRVKQWIRGPRGDLAGVWFVPFTRETGVAKAVTARVRPVKRAPGPR
jgi:transcriptional regulator with XRE-family HTH domain